MSDASHEAFVAIAPFHLGATTAQQLLGHYDPTGRRSSVTFEKVHLDAEARPLVWQMRAADGGFRVRVRGASAGAALQSFLGQFPLRDGHDAVVRGHALVQRLARTWGGLRLIRVPWAFDVAAGAVLQQRVRWQVGYGDFRRIALRFGTRCGAGAAFPTARQLAAVGTARLEALGIDGRRAKALTALARLEANRPFLEREADYARLTLRLQQVPGIGPWTAHMIAGYGAGDPDAVPVGDLHLPSLVTLALADEPEGTDERMLELLEPYRGQRFRIIRLLLLGARRRAPLPGRTTATSS